MPYPPDPNEVFRLEALDRLAAVRLQPDEALDRITAFARDHFRVPACLINVVGADEQISLSCQGADVATLPRENSFCAHAIVQPEVFVIPDASADARFRDNPLVTGDPFLRFYAGAPLVYEGNVRLGSLCIFDSKPRTFSAGDEAELQMLADYAASVLISRILGLPEPDISPAFYA